MKRILVITVLVLTLLCLASCGGNDKIAPNGMVDASAPDAYTYTFYVPASWAVSSFNGMSLAYHSLDDASSLSLSQYKLDSTVSDYSQYWEICKKDYQTNLVDFTLISESNCMLGEQAAGQYEFTAKIAGNQYKYMNVITLKDGMAYVLTYTSLEDKYDSHLEDVTKTVKAFMFEN